MSAAHLRTYIRRQALHIYLLLEVRRTHIGLVCRCVAIIFTQDECDAKYTTASTRRRKVALTRS